MSRQAGTGPAAAVLRSNYWLAGWLDISWPGTGTGVTPGRTPWRGKQRSRRGRGVGRGKRGDTGDGGLERDTEGVLTLTLRQSIYLLLFRRRSRYSSSSSSCSSDSDQARTRSKRSKKMEVADSERQRLVPLTFSPSRAQI